MQLRASIFSLFVDQTVKGKGHGVATLNCLLMFFYKGFASKPKFLP